MAAVFNLPAELRQPSLAALCRRWGVERLELFGSAGTPAFERGRSDIDLIVRFKREAESESLGTRFIGLADDLEALLDARVDLMTDHPIVNPYLRAAIAGTRRVIYEDASA